MRTFAITAAVAALAAASVIAATQVPTDAASGSSQVVVSSSGDRLADPAAVLKRGWQQAADVAWSLAGDADGLHVLAAKESAGYAWSPVATLSEPGFDTDRWIGQGCLTESATRLVVVYAPRTFTNSPELSARGGFTAVVDLGTGAVHKLPVNSTLAYYSPGCGTGEKAVLTQEGDESLPGTHLVTVDAATASVGKPIPVSVGVSSALPTSSGIVAAAGNELVNVAADGSMKGIVATTGPAFDLAVASDGTVVHADHLDGEIRIRQTRSGLTTTLGTGALRSVTVRRSGTGKVFITGSVTSAGQSSGLVQRLPDVTPDEAISTEGDMASQVVSSPATDPSATTSPTEDTKPAPVKIAGRVRMTGKTATFSVASRSAARGAPPVASASSSGSASPMVAGSPTSPIDADRACAIPRNDVDSQVYQPTARQSEWAVDQAVRSALSVSRPAGWRNAGLPAYTPQGLFPMPALSGGGNVPAQIMLGILAQESNMWQASGHAMSGEYGNPLVGNFYGSNVSSATDWSIHWANADCGYGIAQVTTGMRVTDTNVVLTATQQRAVALDYATNIAAGLQILIGKWNQLAAKGMTVNDGKPQWIENWYLALWGYNTGMKSLGDPGTDGTVQGLGWINNPANPHYPANRAPFLEYSYADAATPQYWPYQEKVIGWAGHPINTADGAGYRAAWWTTTQNRIDAQPSPTIACTAANTCYPGQKYTPNDPTGCSQNLPTCVIGEPQGPCAHKSPAGYYNLQCYWSSSINWKGACTTNGNCGNELERFDPGQYPEQPDGTNYPPSCSSPLGSALPSNAIIIDDVPASVPGYRCGTRPPSNGSISWQFKADSGGMYESKMDLQQLGGGYGGHLWFAHTQPAGSLLQVTGTWAPTSRLSGWTRVMVHIPDHGDWTQQAHYHISLGNGAFEDRYIPTDIESNTWVSLGVFNFVAGTSPTSVSLDNISPDGNASGVGGTADVAWDAAAFIPLPGKPQNIVVAMGDSYTSGEGAEPYYPESDRGTPNTGNGAQTGSATWNACRRSKNSLIRKTIIPGQTQNLGALADSLNPAVDLHSIACSGATTYNVDPTGTGYVPNPLWGGVGQHHEMPQLQSGFLDTNTTLVVLTLGGNDAQFATTLSSCANPISGCPSDATVQSNINGAMGQVRKVLPSIRAKAPNAKIVVLGYPALFNATANCATTAMPSAGRTDIVRFSGYMDAAEKAAIAAIGGITYYSPNPQFNSYRICDNTQAINDVVSAPTGPGDFNCPGNPVCISMESYHPNNLGTSRYALALQANLP